MLNESKNLEKKSEVSEVKENYVPPFADIYETKENYTILLDMPGVAKENFKVKIDDDELVLTGNIKNGLDNSDYLYNEIFYSGYNRRFILPTDVNVDKIDAHYENGVLKLVLNKKEEFKPKLIEIK